jgi:hypothetical protein
MSAISMASRAEEFSTLSVFRTKLDQSSISSILPVHAPRQRSLFLSLEVLGAQMI